MSAFKVNIVAVNPRDMKRVSAAIEVRVDTGAGLTWLRRDGLDQIGIEPVRTG